MSHRITVTEKAALAISRQFLEHAERLEQGSDEKRTARGAATRVLPQAIVLQHHSTVRAAILQFSDAEHDILERIKAAPSRAEEVRPFVRSREDYLFGGSVK